MANLNPEDPSALDMSEDILRTIADRDRATDSPVPAAVDAVFAELAHLRAREARLVEVLAQCVRWLDGIGPTVAALNGQPDGFGMAEARAAIAGKESSNG